MKLIPRLEKYKTVKGLVLAVPRGGVPLGYYIAKCYNLPMDLLLTKKIGHPMNNEVAIGAVSLEDYIIDNHHKISNEYIEKEVEKIRSRLKETYKKLMGNRPVIDLKDKVVIIVDDGIATGYTLLAAIRLIKKHNPEKIVVAVPVSPQEAANKIKKEVDDFVCLTIPEDFFGVGEYYYDFSEVSDEKVTELLNDMNKVKNIA
jgi:predicted phosphoribosyltransferase